MYRRLYTSAMMYIGWTVGRLYLMKEMYNNYDEEEEDWDKPEVGQPLHSTSPYLHLYVYRNLYIEYNMKSLGQAGGRSASQSKRFT